MNMQRWDLAYVSRWAGLAIVVIGVAVTIWAAIDPIVRRPANDALAQSVILSIAQYAFWGFVVALIGELASHLLPPAQEGNTASSGTPGVLLPSRESWAHPDNWDVVLLGRLAAAFIMVGGTGVVMWQVLDNDFQQFPFSLNASDRIKLIVTQSLEYILQAFVLVALAEVCERIDWSRGEAMEEPELSAANAEPAPDA